MITAHIRRMGEGTVFSLFVSSHLGGQGPPIQTWDGVPPFLGQGTPRTWDGVPPQTWDGVPLPDLEQGTPHQHSEHLLSGGQYASCVHAGGLSYYFLFMCSIFCCII